jgi:membrane protease YdiL (CAAX protease family)
MQRTGFLHVDGNASLNRAPAIPRDWTFALIIVIVAQWIQWQGVGLSQIVSSLLIQSGVVLGTTEETLWMSYALNGALSLVIPAAIVGAIALYVSAQVDKRGPNSLGLGPATPPLALGWSFAGLVAAVPVIAGIISDQPNWGALAWGGAVLTPVTIVQAGAEEILFRGIVLGSLCARYGVRTGVLTSATLFGAWHLQFGQPLTDAVLMFVSTFVFGVTASIVTLHYANLGPALRLHVVWNVVGYFKAASDQWASDFWSAWISSAFEPWTFSDLLSGDAARYLGFPLLIETLLILGICRETARRVFALRRTEV